MSSFRKSDVESIIAGLELESSNRALAEHWLSLWDGDALPPRAKFNPTKVKRFLATLLLFDVVPDHSVKVRLAGTAYIYALEKEPTGTDWIATGAEGTRATRLAAFSTVARGAIYVGHRRVSMLYGGDYPGEEIALPFAPDANGVVTVLYRMNFEADQYRQIRTIPQVGQDPLDMKLIPFSAVNDPSDAADGDRATTGRSR